MNFVVFPVGTTNIFPLANSSAGGQLLSEMNIRSRESVGTDSRVKYFIGESFTHAAEDFEVQCLRDGQDTTISNTTIQIQPGRAIINGHYVESVAPINIDLNDANTHASREGVAPLKGKLAVGLKMAYSTYQTLAGSALVENDDNYYEGVQVVIIPEESVKLPIDAPGETEFAKVNMHLLLATFVYRNGTISGMKQNEDKMRYINGERISNVEAMLSGTFISKEGLDPNKLYVYAGKSADGEHIDDRDTWCEATDSMIVWDNSPRISQDIPSRQAYFTYDEVSNQTLLVAPHKQVDGMVNMAGEHVYYQDKLIPLPSADFTSGTGGVVTPQYTNRIKDISQKLDLFYRLPNGRMRQYIPVLTNRDDLPAIPVSRDSKWPYSYSEYVLDISGLEARIAEVSADLADLKANINDIIDGRVNTIAPGLINSSIANLIAKITEVGNQASSIDKWLKDETWTGKPPYPGSGSSHDVTSLLNAVYGQPSVTTTPTSGLLYDVTQLQNNWNQYKAEESAAIAAQLTNQLDVFIEKFNTIYDTIMTQENDLKTYINNRVQEALDSRSVFTTWTWQPGDYVLVGEDHTVGANIEGRYPSTMYVVGPAQVRSIRYLEGQDIVTQISTEHGTGTEEYQHAYQTMLRTVPQELAGGIELGSYELVSTDQGGAAGTGLWDVSAYKGAPGIDYFVARLKISDVENHIETWTCYYYTPNLTTDRYSYLDPVWITGGVPLATEQSVGGFVNVSAAQYGNGYVRVNDDGFLQLVDYELLLTGVLSYQLGQDRSEGGGLGLAEIQSILDENVNERVCFPNAEQIQNAEANNTNPYVIHLYLELPEEAGEVVIHDIGTRYGSCLYVHITGTPTSETKITFRNCDKLRIDNNISGAPTIYLENVCLYYDAEVLDACTMPDAISGMTLWYQKFENTDPNIQVDGMTVELVGEVETHEGIDPWDSTYANDNHYSYALRSLTFADDGSIINVGMLVGDSTTVNIDEGKSVFAAEFVLPQSIGLNYPVSKMTHRIKVSGSFVSHYYMYDEQAYMMKHTDFSALTQTYDVLNRQPATTGTISFYTDAEVITHITGVTPTTTIDGWDLNTPHYFIGGVID